MASCDLAPLSAQWTHLSVAVEWRYQFNSL